MSQVIMIQAEKDFYSSFEVKKDHITIEKQLRKINDKVLDGLKKDFGDIIPKQPKEELAKRYLIAINLV